MYLGIYCKSEMYFVCECKGERTIIDLIDVYRVIFKLENDRRASFAVWPQMHFSCVFKTIRHNKG